ncbi:ccsA [Symbiodinium natans]|uniref:CcsA protein n=1 Tax=Symbiodinium natans TaxID=878477 RepID=A0A812N3Q0_9DINO|nr:ccsA [Symbiodinium natans]
MVNKRKPSVRIPQPRVPAEKLPSASTQEDLDVVIDNDDPARSQLAEELRQQTLAALSAWLRRAEVSKRPAGSPQSPPSPRKARNQQYICTGGTWTEFVRDTLHERLSECLTCAWTHSCGEVVRDPPIQRLRRVCKMLIHTHRSYLALHVQVQQVEARHHQPNEPPRGHFATTAAHEFHLEDFWQSYKCRPSTSWASAPVVCTASGTWDLQFRGKRATPRPEIFGSWTSSLFGVRPSSRAATAPSGARREYSASIRPQTSFKWSSSFLDGGDSTVSVWADVPGQTTISDRRDFDESDLNLHNMEVSSCFSWCCYLREVVNSPVMLADPTMLDKVDGLDELPVMDAPLEQYLHACSKLGTRPRPLPFVTGHSPNLHAAGHSLTDQDLLSLLTLTRQVELVEEVDLSDNAKLTDVGMLPFLREVGVKKTCLSLLNLSHCRSLGEASISLLTSIMHQGGLGLLWSLDLSGIGLPMGCARPLLDAIGQHPTLRKVGLASLGIGRLGVRSAKSSLSCLFQGYLLEEVDLAWNTFDSASFAQLGRCLNTAVKLRSLSIAGCSSSSRSTRDLPIEHFLEQLPNAHKLSVLDVTFNHIDFRGAFVIEDACDTLRCLKHLVIADNPLGVLGQRCLFRLLAQKTSGLEWFDCAGCAYQSASFSLDKDSKQIFCPQNPSGRYELDLARPYHRAVLRRLYKTSERFRVRPSVSFSQIKSSSGYQHPHKNRGTWNIATGGDLTVHFQVDCIGNESLDGGRFASFEGYLAQHTRNRRVKPAVHKVVPLIALWRMNRFSAKEQETMLECLCKDFLLSAEQIRALVCCSAVSQTEYLCACSLPQDRPVQVLSMLQTTTMEEYVSRCKYLRTFMSVNYDCPNGHYQLDMLSAADRAVGQHLFVLNAWEVELDKRAQRMDLSELGDGSHWRNITHQGGPWKMDMTRWLPPPEGTLDFDYVSARRPDPKQAPIDLPNFARMLQLLASFDEAPLAKFLALRRCGHRLFMTSSQLRELLCMCKTIDAKLQLTILLYFQVVDISNAKTFRVLFDPAANQQLQKCLGYVVTFLFLQPEGFIELSLDQREQRLLAHCLALLRSKERSNMKDVVLCDKTGRLIALSKGLPKSWESIEKVPSRGAVSLTYKCIPEERSVPFRKQLQMQFGGWKLGTISKQSMTWCTSAAEAPADVLELLHHVLRASSTRTANPGNCDLGFDFLASQVNKTALTRQDLLQALLACGFLPAEDDEEAVRRADDIFEFFIPGRQKFLSRREWCILDELWHEAQQQMQDLVRFAARKFDYSTNLIETIWSHISDGEESLTLPQWSKAIKEKLGFHGPADEVFALLNKAGKDAVSVAQLDIMLASLGDYSTDCQGPRISQKFCTRVATANALQLSQICIDQVLALVGYLSSPAFVPCRTSLKLWVLERCLPESLAALTAPAHAVDDPLAHGVMQEGELQGWAERAAFGGLLVSTLLAWWRGTLGSGQASTEGKAPSFYAMAFANLALVVLLSNRWLESGHFPLSNMYESLSFLAWGVTAVTLYFTVSQTTESEELKAFDLQSNSKSSQAKQVTTDIAAVWASPVALGIVAFAQFSLPKVELAGDARFRPHPDVGFSVFRSPCLYLCYGQQVVMCSYATLMFGSILCQGLLLVRMAVLALSQPKDSPITALREAAQPVLEGIANGLQPQPAVATAGQSPAVAMTGTTGLDAGNTASPIAQEDRAQVAVASTAASVAESEVTVEFTSSSGTAVLSEDDQLAITLDDLAYRSLLLGFGFLTVGIVSGGVWANEAWGNYWSWDPKETWALITWLVYAAYLHTRLQLGWDTRESAKIGAFGFLVVWVCYIGVNLMGIGLHSYGFFLK